MAPTQKTVPVVLNAQTSDKQLISDEGKIVIGKICALLKKSAEYKIPIALVEYVKWGVSYPVSSPVNPDIWLSGGKSMLHFTINSYKNEPNITDPFISKEFAAFISGFSRLVFAGVSENVLAAVSNPAIKGKEMIVAESTVAFGKENKEKMLSAFQNKYSTGVIFLGRELQPLLEELQKPQ
jgi:hypothetical protein